MKIAAMIIGILSGLGLLTYSLIAMVAGDLMSATGGNGGFVKFMAIVIPIAALVGAGMVLQKPLVGGILMVAAAAAILLWLGFSSFTLFLGLPLLVAGGLGIADHKNGAAAATSRSV